MACIRSLSAHTSVCKSHHHTVANPKKEPGQLQKSLGPAEGDKCGAPLPHPLSRSRWRTGCAAAKGQEWEGKFVVAKTATGGVAANMMATQHGGNPAAGQALPSNSNHLAVGHKGKVDDVGGDPQPVGQRQGRCHSAGNEVRQGRAKPSHGATTLAPCTPLTSSLRPSCRQTWPGFRARTRCNNVVQDTHVEHSAPVCV